ncbi:MAG: hypothetical protein ABIN48_12710 [Ginsengibacter sp.]
MKTFFFGFAFLFVLKAGAQVDYPVFKQKQMISPEDSSKLSLNIYNLNYLHDTEYFTDIPLSGTLFGYQLLPELQYQPTSRFIIKAGVYAQKEFGRSEYTSLIPTFSVKYQAKESSYILGNLEGNINHQFIDPIYDDKLLIKEKLENGFQFLVNTKPYNHDFYINWRRAIHLGDPFKEEFDVGYSASLNLIDKENFKVKFPLQMLYSHKGGQIDSTNEPLTSLVNNAVGISMNYNFGKGFFTDVIFDNYYVNYKDISGHKRQLFNQGNAYLSHLLLKFKYFDIDLRYWNGNSFINPRGNSLFSSVSEKYPGLTEKNRELLITSLIYNTQIFNGADFNFRMSPYYDFYAKRMEYSFELYFSYRINILLGKLNNSYKAKQK